MTIGVTWPLWQIREAPPNLPLFAVPQIPYGLLLLASLGLILWKRALGWWVHAALLAAAILSDQLRLQPQMVSTPFLMLLAFPSRGARALGFAHLAAVWFFSGFHKLLSPKFFTSMSSWMLHTVWPTAPEELALIYGATIAFSEVLLGILIFVTQLRKVVANVGLLLHIGILMTLIPVGWNPSVWPWNILLAAAGPLLLWHWTECPRRLWLATPFWSKVASLALLGMPFLYYAGWHAHLCICLYTKNKPVAFIQHAGEEQKRVTFWEEMEVPIPPAHDALTAYFKAVARPGDLYFVRDQRGWAKANGLAQYRMSWEMLNGVPQALLQELGAGRLEKISGDRDIFYRLDFAETAIDDAALEQLASLQGAVEIDLRRTPISDAGLTALSGIPALRRVFVGGTRVTGMGVAAFREKRPNVDVVLE